MSAPLVSVCMITYNHENFIEQAIESILSQVTQFIYEIIICDDKSSDNTLHIIEKYEKKHKIVLIKNEKNLGPWRSLDLTFKKAKGEYIALLEGDDYWIDKTKLEQQISFLEKNEKYSMCFGNVHTIDEFGGLIAKNTFIANNDKTELNYKDILSLNCPPTRTVCFRKSYLPTSFPNCYYLATGGDTYLFAKITKKDPSYFINKPMAVWRIRKNSLYSNLSTYKRRKIINKDFESFYDYASDIEEKTIISSTLAKSFYKLLIQDVIMFNLIGTFKSFKGWFYWTLKRIYLKKKCRNCSF